MQRPWEEGLKLGKMRDTRWFEVGPATVPTNTGGHGGPPYYAKSAQYHESTVSG